METPELQTQSLTQTWLDTANIYYLLLSTSFVSNFPKGITRGIRQKNITPCLPYLIIDKVLPIPLIVTIEWFKEENINISISLFGCGYTPRWLR